MRFFTPLLLALCTISTVFAQDANPVDLAKAYVLEKSGEWNLTSDDLKELVVTDNYVTQHSGTRHIYLTQHYRGIPIHNAIQTVAITKEGRILSVGKTRLIANIADKINSSKPTLSGAEAIGKLIMNVEKRAIDTPQLINKTGKKSFYDGSGIAKQDIPVQLVYELMPNGEVLLAHQVELDQLNSNDWWNARVDARNGEILAKDNYTISCKFDNNPFHNHDRKCTVNTMHKKSTTAASAGGGGSYRVVPYPLESPSHGSFDIVSNPADPMASPFGWHDTDGVAGAEYTITRGNNVHAYPDHNNNDAANNEPDGGPSLDFIYDANFDQDPTAYADAATTNLFYYLNTVHDFSWHYGFDEAAGNFQQTNYSSQGQGGDYIRANAQDGYLTGLDENLNNANYSGGSDGSAARIQMYVWNRTVSGVIVNEPASVAGTYGALEATFGPRLPVNPIVTDVVELNDGQYNPYITDACEMAINTDELEGNIALVDRGGCFFVEKALFAQEAGAVAVIVCNFEDDPIAMGGAAGFDDPTIPSVMMGAIDCATIRSFAGNGLKVTLGQPTNSGPEFLDGDFDNGIIAHEMAHGISNRLTGGPNSGGCLNNDEQMGEGWSDFFGLVMSAKPGDQGSDRRGVGTFVNRQEVDGRGIRAYPYSTDMNINPLTYENVAPSIGPGLSPHANGTVWCTVIWDLYWALVEQYGFDEDLINGDKGNNLAVQLVMDGMKLQNCQPGFLDGRDGILEADEILTGGANQCLIWEVFARRGMGHNADQGSNLSGGDQVAGYEPLPTCIEELKLTKEVTPLIEAGENIDVTLYVVNHRPETLEGVVITEEIPEGLTYVANSGSITGTLDGTTLTFNVGSMEYLDEMEITYQLSSDPDRFSKQLFFQGAENDAAGWAPFPIEGDNLWYPTPEANTGNFAYKVDSRPVSTQQILLLEDQVKIEGDNPVIRMFTNYDLEGGLDGAVFQVTEDFDLGIWSNFRDEIFRGGYPRVIQYSTFVIPDFPGFTGNSETYRDSYIDMNAFKGQELFMRYNFATSDEDGAGAPANGFFAVDDLELMDMINYNPESCIAFDGGTGNCAIAEGRGTIIESQIVSSTAQVENSGINFGVFPNPTNDVLTVSVSSLEIGKANMSLVSIDGKVINTQSIVTSPSVQQFSMNVDKLPAGFYVVRIANENGSVNKKVIIQ